jgi:hypothetical protein
MASYKPQERSLERMRVERSATINHPIDGVFEYASTPHNDPTWVVASLKHEMLSPAPMRVGSITEEDVGFMGLQMRYVWRSPTISLRPTLACEASQERSLRAFASDYRPSMAVPLGSHLLARRNCAASTGWWPP